MHTPIHYPYGVVSHTQNIEDVYVFIDFLEKQTTKDMFIKHGFEIIDK